MFLEFFIFVVSLFMFAVGICISVVILSWLYAGGFFK
nr:MAG TPA: hypothetical protein [Caudoviricetes sp.]